MEVNKNTNYRMNIELSAIVIGFGVVFTSIVLLHFNKFLSDGDLTNGITVTIEIGIGVFIAMAIFFHSKYQQQKSEMLLLDVKDINQKLELQRTTMRETFGKSILKCLGEMWERASLILLTRRANGADEINEPVGKEPVDDIIETYKTQLLQFADQLNTLTLLSSNLLESELLSSLLQLNQEIKDSVVQKGMFAATHPWSAIIWRIDNFVKLYFKEEINSFEITTFEHYLHEKMKNDIKQNR